MTRIIPTCFLLLFTQLLHAQTSCLPASPVAADYPVSAEGLKALFETAQQKAELSPEAYEALKTQVNRCNNEMEVALSGILSQMSELSLKYQQILGYKDVAGIEKQLRDLEDSHKKSRTELEQNLGYVKHSGIFVVLLEGVDFYKKQKEDLIVQANQTITARAVEDLVGVNIRRVGEIRDFAPVRDVVQEIKDGEVRMEREYFNQSNHNRKLFLFVARIGATPSRQKAPGANASASNALVINLGLDGDYRQKLLQRGVSEADLKRIEQEVLPFLPNVQRDNKTADSRQDYILQNGTEKVRGLDRDIEDARLRLATRSAKIAEICKELGVPFNSTNFDQSVNAALQKIKDRLRELTTQWNQTAEREIIYKDTRTFVEGSLSQSLAAEALKLCGQLEKGYGQLDRILQVTEVENFDVTKFENSRTVSVFRKPQKIWAYAMPRDDGAYGVVTFAQFKVTGMGQAGSGDSNTRLLFESDMVFVEGGTFKMGCTSEQGRDCIDSEKPVHQITLPGFYIAKYEVTQAQWKAVMGTTPSYFKDCGQCPVEQVSWDDIQEFLKKLNQKTGKNYRLPTEAEWEFAARGGNKSKAYKYAGSNNLDEVAWYSSNSGSSTHAVGGKKANELGLFDMSGNVWEWCSDWYDPYLPNAQNNPKGPSTGSNRVLRGGSWYYGARYCRVAHRYLNSPGYRGLNVGFRLSSSSL